jgi:cytoskeleton-associated protein 5
VGNRASNGALAAIFKKIGEKATSQEGLMDLYLYKEEHPEVDLMAHLSKTSQNFRDYVARGVRKAAERCKAAADTGGCSVPDVL